MEREDIENSPVRKRKRTMSSPGQNKDSSLDDSVSSTLSSKSFYGSRKKKYVTPLERRDISNIRGEDSDHNSSISSARSFSSPLQQGRHSSTPKSSVVKKSALGKPSAVKKLTPNTKNRKLENKQESVIVATNKSDIPSTESSSTKDKNGLSSDNVTPKKEVVKKFFRNSSPSKKARRSGMSVQIMKGINIKYEPSGVAKRPRSPRKKLLTPNGKINTKKENAQVSLTPKKVEVSKPSTPTRTPERSQCATPNRNKPTTPSRISQRLKCATSDNTSAKQIASCDGMHTPNKRLSVSSCKTSTPRRSPRVKQVSVNEVDAAEGSDEDMFDEVDSGVGKTTQEYELKMFESPAKSSSQADLSMTPDSVMLISEIGSESSPHSTKSSK